MATNRMMCQRIGCNALFTHSNNPENSCTYHEGAPVFHDGMKEWSCCKQRSHDFSLFLDIPGCKTGRHTTEKPVTKAAPSPNKTLIGATAAKVADSAKSGCPRCRQGFFCAEHGSGSQAVQSKCNPDHSKNQPVPAEDTDGSCPVPEIVDLNEPQLCKNMGCGKTYREKDNHDSACEYHPGPATFRDRMRGWKCCGVRVKDFDEFLAVPPCTKGWHSGNPT